VSGRDAVIEACDSSLDDMAAATTEFVSFRTIVGAQSVAVDAVGRYTDSDGVSVVSSCDLYDFEDGRLIGIRSYNVELDDGAA